MQSTSTRPFCSPPGGHEMWVPDESSPALGNTFAVLVKAGMGLTGNNGTVFYISASPS